MRGRAVKWAVRVVLEVGRRSGGLLPNDSGTDEAALAATTKVKFSKSLCSVTVKRGRIVPGGWATSRVARRRSGPSSPKFAISPRQFVAAHLERRPAARSGRSPHVRPMPPHFRPWRAESAANGPPRTEKWGHWPHVGGSAVSRRRAPLEMRNNKLMQRKGEFRRGRPATPTRRAPLIRPFYNVMTVTEHSDFESLTFVNEKYRRDKL